MIPYHNSVKGKTILIFKYSHKNQHCIFKVASLFKIVWYIYRKYVNIALTLLQYKLLATGITLTTHY